MDTTGVGQGTPVSSCVPVSAVAYGFLKLIGLLQGWIFQSIPKDLGLTPVPVWWPLPLLALSGILVAATIQYLPGTAGHIPADRLFLTQAGPEQANQGPRVLLTLE